MERRRGSLMSASYVEHNDFYNPNPNYLTIVALEDGCEVSFYPLESGLIDDPYAADISTLQYSINGSDEWIYYESSPSIVINKDDYVSFKGDLVPIELKLGDIGIGNFYTSSLCNLTGNCNSILFGDDADSNFDLTGYDYCYSYMFGWCPVVDISPTFLPATTLADNCYEYMFTYCDSLTTAPELPATTLADECYIFMFDGCRKLNYIKAMFTTKPSNSYTYGWVSGVASSGTFVKNKNATWNVTGTNGIPSGWTVQTA